MTGVDQSRLRLLKFQPRDKPPLAGFATIELPTIGLIILDLPVFFAGGKCWASLPGKPVLGQDGKQVETSGGKKLFSPVVELRDQQLGKSFLAAVVELVRSAQPEALLDDRAAP